MSAVHSGSEVSFIAKTLTQGLGAARVLECPVTNANRFECYYKILLATQQKPNEINNQLNPVPSVIRL